MDNDKAFKDLSEKLDKDEKSEQNNHEKVERLKKPIIPKGLKELRKALKSSASLETDEVVISVVQLFGSIQQDTRAILDQVSGAERRLTEQNQKAMELIQALDKRVVALESNAAKHSDIDKGSSLVKRLGTVIIILIMALVANTFVTYYKPPTIIVMPGIVKQ